jgi:hypothetical protein
MQLIMNREHYFILAGETSADLLGASLMRSMQKISPSSIKWIGIGGEQMQKQGLISNLPISELSVIGTLDAFGIDSEKAWDEVLKANMKKEVGVKETRPNPLGLPDLIKPEGWTAPSHEDNHGKLHNI